jgi:hypothetical protein
MKLDIEAIKRRHLDPEKTAGRTMYEGHITIDLGACVDEIEHLRDQHQRILTMLQERVQRRAREAYAAWDAADGDGVAWNLENEVKSILTDIISITESAT